MNTYRCIAVGESAPRAVTLGVERNAEGAVVAVVWWPAHDDVDGDEAIYPSVSEGLAAAEAARALHGFEEVVVMLQSDDLWQSEWGHLDNGAAGTLNSDEAFELARATEASRDA